MPQRKRRNKLFNVGEYLRAASQRIRENDVGHDEEPQPLGDIEIHDGDDRTIKRPSYKLVIGITTIHGIAFLINSGYFQERPNEVFIGTFTVLLDPNEVDIDNLKILNEV